MADADVWRAIANLERRVARLESRLAVSAEVEPETSPGVQAPGASPILDAFADALGALGFSGE